MENEKSLVRFLKKFALIISVVVLCLVLIVWTVLQSSVGANIRWVIPVRKLYHERVVEPSKLPDELPYVIQARDIVDGVYEYELWGRIRSVDYTTYIMTLVDKGGREWRVQMIHTPYHEANKIGIEIHEFEIERSSGKTVGRAVPLTIDRRDPDQTEAYLAVGDMMSVVWKDNKKLSEILRQSHAVDYLVVVTGDITRPIRKVVGE